MMASYLSHLTVRLIGGSNPFEGRVEVFHAGSWGTVCDDYWTIEDANVVCHQLGFERASKAVTSARFGEGTGNIWMDDVNCGGNERKLSECKHQGWGKHDCGHSKDAGAICIMPGKQEMPSLKNFLTIATDLPWFFLLS